MLSFFKNYKMAQRQLTEKESKRKGQKGTDHYRVYSAIGGFHCSGSYSH